MNSYPGNITLKIGIKYKKIKALLIASISDSVVNFFNILLADIAPIFFRQLITKPNCNSKKAKSSKMKKGKIKAKFSSKICYIDKIQS